MEGARRGRQLSHKAPTVIPQARTGRRPAVVCMEEREIVENINSSAIPCT